MTRPATLYQVGVLQAYFHEVYDGTVSYAEIMPHGDFGLGTYNAINGEVIALDGKFYHIDYTGQVRDVDSKAKTPFAMVTQFQEDDNFIIQNIASFDELKDTLDKHIASTNYIYMLRIDGEFEYLKCRSVKPLQKPYQPILESLETAECYFELEKTRGTLVVARFPAYLSQLNNPGYHMHYIDAAKQNGGHVIDVTVANANVKVCQIKNLHVMLDDSDEFRDAEMDVVDEEEISVEE